MSEELTPQAKSVREAAESLGEHFDAVIILVSYCEEGVTKSIKWGTGNFYARIGMARAFIAQDAAADAAYELGRVIHPEE